MFLTFGLLAHMMVFYGVGIACENELAFQELGNLVLAVRRSTNNIHLICASIFQNFQGKAAYLNWR